MKKKPVEDSDLKKELDRLWKLCNSATRKRLVELAKSESRKE